MKDDNFKDFDLHLNVNVEILPTRVSEDVNEQVRWERMKNIANFHAKVLSKSFENYLKELLLRY